MLKWVIFSAPLFYQAMLYPAWKECAAQGNKSTPLVQLFTQFASKVVGRRYGITTHHCQKGSPPRSYSRHARHTL